MSWQKLRPLLFALVLIALGAGVFVRTVANHGPAAVARMGAAERALLTKLETLHMGMSRAEVIGVLGEPDDLGGLGRRPKWQIGGSPFNVIVVSIFPDGARRIVWLSVGRFIYERNLVMLNAQTPSADLAVASSVSYR